MLLDVDAVVAASALLGSFSTVGAAPLFPEM